MTIAEFIYTIILKPKPLRMLANASIRCVVPSLLERHGVKIALNPLDPVISGALTLNVYEQAETKFFLSTCKPGMTFLDIGANVGYYTALALSRMRGSGRIVALEPDPENYRFLQKTIAANAGSSSGVVITTVPKAASDHSGRMTLFTSSDNRGDNRLYANQLADSQCDVDVLTVDSLLDEMNISTVDFIKMDVQGYEGFVIRGMKTILERSRAAILLSEFWPEGLRHAGTSPEEFLSELGSMDFEVSELCATGEVRRIADPTLFIEQFPGRKYTNIVAMRRCRSR
jgi:FkbM family methyltransferase